MSRTQEEREIDGVRYRVTKVGGETGGEFIFRVGRVLAGAVDGTAGLFLALQSLPPSEFKWAIDVLKNTTEVLVVDDVAGQNAKGDTPARWVKMAHVYDQHFRGNWGAWRKWVGFAVEVSFGSFFADIVKEARERMRRKEPSSSPSTDDDGGSGDSSSTSG